MVQDIAAGDASSTPLAFSLFRGLVLFFADDGTHGREPWIGRASMVTARPQRAIGDLTNEVRALGLGAQTEAGLITALDQASKALAAGRTSIAETSLRSLTMEIDALSPTWISEETAIGWIEFADQILALLDSGQPVVHRGKRPAARASRDAPAPLVH